VYGVEWDVSSALGSAAVFVAAFVDDFGDGLSFEAAEVPSRLSSS